MRARQRETGAGVIESRRVLPVIKGMAARAVLPQLALMRVLMTGKAVAREAQETSVKVLHFDARALAGRNTSGVVALLASQAGMFSYQNVTGFRVVEGFQGGFPTNELEVLPIVFGVATRAVFLAALGIHHGRMVTAVRGEPLGDFRVTFEATKFLTSSAKTVAERALRGSVPCLVRPRKRPRGNLREDRRASPDERSCDCKEQTHPVIEAGIRPL